jgi:hypothetical protein
MPRLLRFVLPIITILTLATVLAWTQAHPPTGAAQPAPPKLMTACKATLAAIEKNRPTGLEALLAAGGVTLGSAKTPTPRKALVDDLRAKRDFHCRVLGAKCRANGAPSFREEFAAAGSQYATCTLDPWQKSAGTLVVSLDKRTAKEKKLTFLFVLEKGEWRLSGLPGY